MNMTNIKDDSPARLSGLKQATYILEQLAEGKMPPQIVDNLDNDSQLVEIWIDFLVDIKWIERDKTCLEAYTVTEKGKRWLAKLAVQQETPPSQLSNTSV